MNNVGKLNPIKNVFITKGHKVVYMIIKTCYVQFLISFSLLFALEQNVFFFRFETSGSKAIGL